MMAAAGWLGLAAALPAQGRPAPASTAAKTASASAGVVAEVVRAERQLLEAMTTRNTAQLDRLLAPHFALVSAFSSGEVIPRADWIAGLLERRSADNGTIDAPDVRLHAPGVATVVARIAWTTADAGPTPQREEYLVTDTWVRRGRTWQLAARHSSARRAIP